VSDLIVVPRSALKKQFVDCGESMGWYTANAEAAADEWIREIEVVGSGGDGCNIVYESTADLAYVCETHGETAPFCSTKVGELRAEIERLRADALSWDAIDAARRNDERVAREAGSRSWEFQRMLEALAAEREGTKAGHVVRIIAKELRDCLLDEDSGPIPFPPELMPDDLRRS
jgi:hypothetical protein